jgi:tetratricopeptide (TPR) repeat protein
MTFRTWWCGVLAVAMFAAAPAAWADDEAPEDDFEAVEPDESSASADAVFEFLVAEVAAQRGDIDSALATYHRMARELRDPAIARRAVELAVRARAFGPALESSALLLEIEPGSSLAREIMAALLANEGKIDKARDTLAGMLDKSRSRGPMLLQLQHLLAKFPDKAATLEATRSLTAPYQAMPEARYALGVAAFLADKLALATSEADAALELRPGWDQGAILKAQVLRKGSPDKVIAFYQGFVEAHPAVSEVRMQLGRELAGER